MRTTNTREAIVIVWKVYASPASFSTSMVAQPEWETVVLESMGKYLVIEIVRTRLRNEEEMEEVMTAFKKLLYSKNKITSKEDATGSIG